MVFIAKCGQNFVLLDDTLTTAALRTETGAQTIKQEEDTGWNLGDFKQKSKRHLSRKGKRYSKPEPDLFPDISILRSVVRRFIKDLFCAEGAKMLSQRRLRKSEIRARVYAFLITRKKVWPERESRVSGVSWNKARLVFLPYWAEITFVDFLTFRLITFSTNNENPHKRIIFRTLDRKMRPPRAGEERMRRLRRHFP